MPEAIKHTISGVIYDEYNRPLKKARVKIYEVDLRKEIVLGAVITNDKGFYSFTYTTQPTDIEFKTPDIVLKIVKSGAAKISGISPIYFNIQPETTINYRLGGKEVLPINEFDRIVDLVYPLLAEAKIAFSDLEETTNNKDLSFLSGETGIPLETLQAFAQSFKLADKSKVSAEFYFPILMNNIAINNLPDFVEDVFARVIDDTLKKGVENNLIAEPIYLNSREFIEVFVGLLLKKYNKSDPRPSKIKKPNR